MSEIGRVLFGFVEVAVGLLMLAWPRQMRAPWISSADPGGSEARRGVVLVQRLIGLAFTVMGAVIVYSGLVPAEQGLERIALLVFALLWVVVGVVMLLWPARVRSLTNPDWGRYQTWPLAATSLVWYRVSGIGFALIGSLATYALLSGR
jgi:hypothetical protein